ncbi:MAG: hypothetical protein CMH61_02385, partial [Nanoarchaeota archaeon]|nr:hypothetical protein [Nanoarchaeota archaeon]
MKSKKGQVTIFIILGLIMVFGLVLFYSLTSKITKETVDSSGRPVIAQVSQEFRPIQLFTESCVRSTAERGLLILGQQGGYIYPELVGEFSETEPTEGRGIVQGNMRVPFWHHNVEPSQNSKVILSSGKPALKEVDDAEMSIESQLNRYIEGELPSCLNGYSLFLNQGFSVLQGTIDVETKMTEFSVQVLVDMPLDIQRSDVSESPEAFFVELPIDLKHIYEIADK